MMSLKAQRSCPSLNFITAFSAVVELNREGKGITIKLVIMASKACSKECVEIINEQ